MGGRQVEQSYRLLPRARVCVRHHQPSSQSENLSHFVQLRPPTHALVSARVRYHRHGAFYCRCDRSGPAALRPRTRRSDSAVVRRCPGPLNSTPPPPNAQCPMSMSVCAGAYCMCSTVAGATDPVCIAANAAAAAALLALSRNGSALSQPLACASAALIDGR